jgi:hypothetical protein
LLVCLQAHSYIVRMYMRASPLTHARIDDDAVCSSWNRFPSLADAVFSRIRTEKLAPVLAAPSLEQSSTRGGRSHHPGVPYPHSYARRGCNSHTPLRVDQTNRPATDHQCSSRPGCRPLFLLHLGFFCHLRLVITHSCPSKADAFCPRHFVDFARLAVDRGLGGKMPSRPPRANPGRLMGPAHAQARTHLAHLRVLNQTLVTLVE